MHLAHALDVHVVAEGVETTGQLDTLILAGCALAQGYLFSVPISADEIGPWLLAGAPAEPRPAPAHADVSP